MVEKEQVIDWLEHPVTCVFKQLIKESIDSAKDLTQINIETSSMDEVAQETFARANYIKGLQDATDFDYIFEEALRDA